MIKIFFTQKVFSLLIIIYIILLVIATFIEKKFSTETAQALIYYSKWFEFFMLILIINFIGNIIKYKFFNKKKLPIFIFHISFIFIFLGGVISRYFGYNGTLSLREGEKSNNLISNKKYFNINLSDNNNCLKSNIYYILSNFNKNYKKRFFLKNLFYKNNLIFQIENYIKNVKEIFLVDKFGRKYINIITYLKGKPNNNFIKDGTIKNIGGLYFSFNKHVKGIINFWEKGNKIYIQAPIEIFNKKKKETGVINQNLISQIILTSFYRIRNLNFFIDKSPFFGNIYYIPINNYYNYSNYPSSLRAKIFKNKKIKKFNFLIKKNFNLIKTNINLGGKILSLRYGQKILNFPFYVKLKKFILEKYPGSSQPSSFKSQLQIIEKDKIINYNIYMNNILDYKGFRFFQSGYNSDEKGTILYVSHDFIGYFISYMGYIFLIIGMIFTFFWKETRFYKLKSKLNRDILI
ncbi:cytochrome c biogenesis protein ResB [Candidatus Karelsulcia muelleri]|uniref:cytochrome c biogenesis protein ResB n=1 Tax=Candidatus Karelsulcia muelleri TaxID=336810 RepID=UPI000D7C115B|nr:cytochrome c biogenesis protein ResB [Candidatus Karelsulcia muelleri]